MGKRSDFKRVPRDAYQTVDPRAVAALVPFLAPETVYAEPCAGDGLLIEHLARAGHVCGHASDIATGTDALSLQWLGGMPVITNPPWRRSLLHPLIGHWLTSTPYFWLLFDSGWAFTAQAADWLPFCTHVVATPRLQWIPDSDFTAKDDTAWYRFEVGARGPGPTLYPVRTAGRTPKTRTRRPTRTTANAPGSLPQLH